MLKLFNKNN